MKTLIVLLLVLSLTAPSTQSLGSLFRTLMKIPETLYEASKLLGQFWHFYRSELDNQTPLDGQEFDFVIVGAGSSGSVIASRLTEVFNVSVLLLEAGGHESYIFSLPFVALLLTIYPNLGWGYKTEKSDKYCTGFENQQCLFHSGKVMGGSSSVNAIIAIRGNRHDYDEWSKLTGDPNWSYKGMLKYFKKLENFQVNMVPVEREYHSFNGPVNIINPYISPVGRAFAKAGEELGFPPLDYNGPKQTGFSYLQSNRINGERLSSNRAYLHPVRERSNLMVSMYSHVTKVLINPKTKAAYGVEFVKNGRKYKVKAKKEVILCAGALSTPKILMLSGIGPGKHLRSFNISVLQDAPVGENMKDHITYGTMHFFVNGTPTVTVPDVFKLSNNVLLDYLKNRKGPLTSAGAEVLGLLNVNKMTAEEDESPNMEILLSNISLFSSVLGYRIFGIRTEDWKRIFAPHLYKQGYLVWPLLMKPKSKGKVLLKSTDPFDLPRIIPNYFSDPEDIKVVIKGIRLMLAMSKSKTMQEYGMQYYNFTVPGCEKYVPDSDDYWECAARSYTITLWHYCGTAKMGRDDDPNSVLNSRLQVKGIKNLRVGDISIMPEIVTAHTNVPAMAIGEHLSDILKKAHGYIK